MCLFKLVDMSKKKKTVLKMVKAHWYLLLFYSCSIKLEAKKRNVRNVGKDIFVL